MSAHAAEKAKAAQALRATLRSVRQARRMRTHDVARQMGMPLRTYEHFEAGETQFDLGKVQAFARATDADVASIISSLLIEAPGLAVRTMDNKLMELVLTALKDFNDDVGDRIAALEGAVILSVMNQAFAALREHLDRGAARPEGAE